MTTFDLLIMALAFFTGVIAAYRYFRQQTGVIEERAENDPERWKIECTRETGRTPSTAHAPR